MAKNNFNAFVPQGTKYKVFLEKRKENDFMVLYAKNKENALQIADEVWEGTGWKPTKAEEV